jgi:hypothetical protein
MITARNAALQATRGASSTKDKVERLNGWRELKVDKHKLLALEFPRRLL